MGQYWNGSRVAGIIRGKIKKTNKHKYSVHFHSQPGSEAEWKVSLM